MRNFRRFMAIGCLALSGVATQVYSADYGSVKAHLNNLVLSEASADEMLAVAGELIKCRAYPTSAEAYDATLARLRDQLKAGATTAANVDYFVETASRCLGLDAGDFHMAEKLMASAAEMGNVRAQLGYAVYVAPQNMFEQELVDPSIPIEKLSSNAINFLNDAVNHGEMLAYHHLAALYFDGSLVRRDPVKAAAYLTAYETCTGVRLSGEYDKYYANVGNKLDDVARLAEQLVEDACQ